MKDKIIEHILDGNAIIFPTDTVYGLGCIPEKNAIDNIYSLKKRDKSKKIIALVSSVEKIKEITNEIDYTLVNKFMPGPLTIICKSNDKFAKLIGDTIGIRIPKNKIALKIIDKVGGIMMTTSANISGEKSPLCLKDISNELLEKITYALKSEENLSGIPSTIIMYLDGKYTLIREGQIKFEEILKIGGTDI